jgi:hypothetical protein
MKCIYKDRNNKAEACRPVRVSKKVLLKALEKLSKDQEKMLKAAGLL